MPVLLQLLQVAADQQLAALLQETHAGDQCEAEETAAESPASCQEPSPTWMSDVDEPEMTDAEQDQDEDADEEQVRLWHMTLLPAGNCERFLSLEARCEWICSLTVGRSSSTSRDVCC